MITSHYLLTKLTPQSYLSFEDEYEENYPDWRQKSERLQARRWRKIKHQLV